MSSIEPKRGYATGVARPCLSGFERLLGFACPSPLYSCINGYGRMQASKIRIFTLRGIPEVAGYLKSRRLFRPFARQSVETKVGPEGIRTNRLARSRSAGHLQCRCCAVPVRLPRPLCSQSSFGRALCFSFLHSGRTNRERFGWISPWLFFDRLEFRSGPDFRGNGNCASGLRQRKRVYLYRPWNRMARGPCSPRAVRIHRTCARFARPRGASAIDLGHGSGCDGRHRRARHDPVL